MKTFLFTLLLTFSTAVFATTPPGHPVQAYMHSPGYYVLKNHDPYNAYSCWVVFPDGYQINFYIYPNFVTNPFPIQSDFGCY